jgi:dihydrodipicolinate synthase/N-acetylneuraminate lyase
MAVDMSEIALLRLAAQRLVGPRETSVAEAVSHVGALQAQAYPGLLTSAALRVQGGTREAVEAAMEAGADACLVVTPYYNKPTQEGLYRHFRKIAETVELPMIVYNVPARTVADLANDTVLRLAQVPGIIGIKDATANIERGTDLVKRAPRGFAIYSGEDSTALALILLGGHGVISVTANVAPKLMHQMCDAALVGDVKRAREINAYYAQLGEGLGQYVPPLVSTASNKPLSIALEEIAREKIVPQHVSDARRAAEELLGLDSAEQQDADVVPLTDADDA